MNLIRKAYPLAMIALRNFVLAIIFCTVLQSTEAQARNSDRLPPPLGALVDVGGYRVHLYCTGAGSPTVLILGAGSSFAWGLIQPEASKDTRVCTYDHSGTTWSDDGPPDSCFLRVTEVHAAMQKLGVKAPVILVGQSVGGLVARLYAARFPHDVGGLIFVDHAVTINAPSSSKGGPMAEMAAPTHIQVRGIESDPNFSRLPAENQSLQLWAVSEVRYKRALEASAAIAAGCEAELKEMEAKSKYPLGSMPIVDVDRNMGATADYANLQSRLLSLSSNSKELTSESSGHFIMIDSPELVLQAISEVVHSIRSGTHLSSRAE